MESRYEASTIAKSILWKAMTANKTLTPMQLQKLVYFAHGWNLAITDGPLLNEQVEAWRYGPVIPSLYHEFKRFGAGSITLGPEDVEHAYQGLDGHTRSLVDRIWDVYGNYDGAQLSAMTHRDGTPWDQTIKEYAGRPPRGTDIHPDQIRDHFLEIWRSNSPEAAGTPS